MNRRGFTIIELLVVITIMGILLTLGVANLRGTQINARDEERKGDVSSIATHLETYFKYGIPTGTSVPTITNLITNPNIETGVTNVVGSNVTTTQSGAWSSSGSYSLQLTPNGASTDSYAWIGCPSGSGITCFGMQAGKTYTLSAWLRIPSTLTGTLFTGRTAAISLWQLSGGVYTSAFSASDPTTGIRPLSVTFSIASNATEAFLRLYNGGSVGAGSVFYDSIMLTEGTTGYNYGDGSTAGWTWGGTANSSTSSGPAALIATPGTYPGVSITSSPLITTYLPDADTKTSFTAPGQSNPYTTFIPATNAIQTAAGVLPQPTISQYVYQPIDSLGNLCYSYDCRKFNIYYRSEIDNTVNMITSKNQ
jgi:prepilin-type N-terminal cleavage/methylation domain-containing protein